MSAVEHEHKWKTAMHLDGCHYYSSAYTCSCGAGLSMWQERTLKDGGYGTLMANPEECERCQALVAGARRRPRRAIVTEPDGTTHPLRRART